MKVGNI